LNVQTNVLDGQNHVLESQANLTKLKYHLLEHQLHVSKLQVHLSKQKLDVSRIENHISNNQIQVSKAQKNDYGNMTNVFGMDFRGEDGLDLASPPPSPSKCNLNPPPLPPPNYLIPIDLIVRPPSFGPLPQPFVPPSTSHGSLKFSSS
jgi:hypothetical protein